MTAAENAAPTVARPILFSALMVRAILARTKTQTRRIVKPQPHWLDAEHGKLCSAGWAWRGPADVPRLRHFSEASSFANALRGFCPYGQPGSRLWVRETWHTIDGERAFYRADYKHDPEGDREHGITWRPSIHMPRWASRITLEVTAVRVERLQDISEADARAEGITPLANHPSDVAAYRELWEQINGAGSWDANSWVWVVDFRRLD